MVGIAITEEGMTRTGEYVNKLRKAQQDGIVDNIPTATDILAELNLFQMQATDIIRFAGMEPRVTEQLSI